MEIQNSLASLLMKLSYYQNITFDRLVLTYSLLETIIFFLLLFNILIHYTTLKVITYTVLFAKFDRNVMTAGDDSVIFTFSDNMMSILI